MSDCIRLMEVDELIVPLTSDLRSYAPLVESICNQGYWVGDYLVCVLEKPDYAGRIVYEVLDGRRRILALQWLRDNRPAEYRRVLPGGRIIARIF